MNQAIDQAVAPGIGYAPTRLSERPLAKARIAVSPSASQAVRLQQIFERTAAAQPQALCAVFDREELTYAQMDARANQVAHFLIAHGVTPGDTVGLLLERSVPIYALMLGILKAGAVFVPCDPTWPAARLKFIASDAKLHLLLTSSSILGQLQLDGVACLAVDQIDEKLSRQSPLRPEMGFEGDALCYIIYTSGTTGQPKGVAVNHSSICNFIRVVTPIYGYTPADRVYQGMTLSFDFSIEEVWPTFAVGAALVAGPTDHRRLASGLSHFLVDRRVSVFCCVPTLLATLDRDIPSLRLLIVGGEVCPQDLVRRWWRPERRMLNTYGPTETTVTATWSELLPDRPVTIGKALPTYLTYLLDDAQRPVAAAQTGEICIGGPGVAEGYLNRPELTAAKFLPDPFLPNRPNARIYRTGDLGRLTADGEIEFLGRIDSQVKIRGYRIELSEIESVIREFAPVEDAIAAKIAHEAGDDLAAYVKLREGSNATDKLKQELHEALRRKLPGHMVPGFIEFIDHLPTLASGKADRSKLPPPRSPRMASAESAYVAPTSPLEREVAAAWMAVFGLKQASIDADFFLELGGHSLFAAAVISRLRRNVRFQSLSISDLYQHPTIRALAKHIESVTPTADRKPAAEAPRRLPQSAARVWRCGAGQVACVYGFLTLFAFFLADCLKQADEPSGQLWGLAGKMLFLTLVVWPAISLALPLIAKWLLLGKVRAGRHRLWGGFYLRWWLVRKVCTIAPFHLLAGSPLLGAYLRLYGAKIGRGCHIGTGHFDCFDLLEIGHGASLGYGVESAPSVVENGTLILAPIHVGKAAFVGTNVVLMPGATVGDGACVLDQSLVASGQVIPANEIWQGSPSRPTTATPPALAEMMAKETTRPPTALTAAFAACAYLLLLLPVLVSLIPAIAIYLAMPPSAGMLTAVYAGLLAGIVFVPTVCLIVALGKRLVLPRVQPGIYPEHSWFGLRKWLADKLQEFSLASTNALYATLYTPPWLRLLGAKVGPRSEIATVSHLDPSLLEIGTESFVADIATLGPAVYCHGQVMLGTTQLQTRSFVGNAATIPANTRLGNETLIGVQSIPPGPVVGDGTSWLGSPPIFLPRRQASQVFAEALTYRPTPQLVVGRLAIEFVRIVLPPGLLFMAMFATVECGVTLAGQMSEPALAAVLPAVFLAAGLAVYVIVAALKWLIVGHYVPRVKPLWSVFVRRSELITGLYECAAVPALLHWFTGTPLMPPLLRLLGVKVGRNVYIETTYITEFDLVSIGDGTQVNARVSLQTHLFEDRVMKMSHIRIGRQVSIGPRAVVLYDSSVEDAAQLDALSLVMKGETLPAATSWRGIPARLRQS